MRVDYDVTDESFPFISLSLELQTIFIKKPNNKKNQKE